METKISNQLNETERPVKWGGLFNEFFWICSGANRKILRQCPTEYSKYFGIGGTIFFTAAMAMLSGGYAFFTIFDSTSLAVCFGVFWGLLIFNLDRFIVNTMYSDGKHTISKDELKAGCPRIILAIFLGIVISTPIELRIFADKIESQLLIDQGNTEKEIDATYKTLYDDLDKLKTERLEREEYKNSLRSGVSTNNDIREKEKELKEAEDKLYSETNGTGVTGRVGYGPAAKQIQDQVDRLKGELNDMRNEALADKENNKQYIDGEITRTNTQIANLDVQIEKLQARIDAVIEQGTAAKSALDGFTAQLNAMYEITSFSNSKTLFFARLMIMFLFIAIEIIPTIFKMMLASGPYDESLREEMERKKAASILNVSTINDEANTQIKISTEKNKDRIEAEVAANKMLLKKIAETQAELLETAIEEWRKEELEKIKANPSQYIKQETTLTKKTV